MLSNIFYLVMGHISPNISIIVKNFIATDFCLASIVITSALLIFKGVRNHFGIVLYIDPVQKRFTIETFQPSELLVFVLVARSVRMFYELAHEEIWCIAKTDWHNFY